MYEYMYIEIFWYATIDIPYENASVYLKINFNMIDIFN